MPPHGHSIDEYLETIYFLAFPIGEYRPQTTGTPTLAARVAEMLGVSRASAGEMLKRLEAEGLIERGEHKEAILTAFGPRARRARRPQAPPHRADADRLHGLHGRRVARARRRARRRVHRRHGRADRRAARATRTAARTAGRSTPPFEQAENRELAPLADLPPGTRATIVRLAEHDGELLHWFYDQGLAPGTRGRGRDRARRRPDHVASAASSALGDKAAAGLFVRPA